VYDAYSKQRRGESLRYIERAIVKYGAKNFTLFEQDIVYKDQQELDEKETYWMKLYDTLNLDKGYNTKEGGLGGLLTPEVKEKLSQIGKEKWENDLEKNSLKSKDFEGLIPKYRDKIVDFHDINKVKDKDRDKDIDDIQIILTIGSREYIGGTRNQDKQQYDLEGLNNFNDKPEHFDKKKHKIDEKQKETNFTKEGSFIRSIHEKR